MSSAHTQETEMKLRGEWLDFWNKESVHTEQKYLTPDTHGIVLDFILSRESEQPAQPNDGTPALLPEQKKEV